MKRLLLTAAFLLAPATVFAADLSGSWTINGDVAGGAVKYSSACNLKQDGAGKLTGACKGTQQEDAAVTGSVNGDAVEFAYDTTYQGSPVHLAYKGALQPDGSVKGTVDTGGPPGVFTLTK